MKLFIITIILFSSIIPLTAVILGVLTKDKKYFKVALEVAFIVYGLSAISLILVIILYLCRII